MKLWFSEGSPFARKVRIVLAEKALEYEKDLFNGIRPIDAHRKLHPGLAIPVLQDRGLTLFESNLVVAYLLETYPQNAPDSPQPPLIATMTRPSSHWEDAKTLSVLETLTSTIVNLKLMRDDGATSDTLPYLKRQEARVESCLDWLEDRATLQGFAPGWFSIMDVNLICAVSYAHKRNVLRELGGRPRLKSTLACFAGRPSIVSTPVNAAPMMGNPAA